jgi:ubiquinone/menaquinone biosynthesis C-methylase UbiE
MIFKAWQCQKILDVGCADGYTTSLISEGSYFVIGVDLNMESLKVAKNKVKCGVFINASIDHLPFRGDCFDVA